MILQVGHGWAFMSRLDDTYGWVSMVYFGSTPPSNNGIFRLSDLLQLELLWAHPVKRDEPTNAQLNEPNDGKGRFTGIPYEKCNVILVVTIACWLGGRSKISLLLGWSTPLQRKNPVEHPSDKNLEKHSANKNARCWFVFWFRIVQIALPK